MNPDLQGIWQNGYRRGRKRYAQSDNGRAGGNLFGMVGFPHSGAVGAGVGLYLKTIVKRLIIDKNYNRLLFLYIRQGRKDMVLFHCKQVGIRGNEVTSMRIRKFQNRIATYDVMCCC